MENFKNTSNLDFYSKQRESVLLYLKVDFGLLAILGTCVTLFKLERIEVLEAISSLKTLFLILVSLICFGLLLERLYVLDFKLNDDPNNIYRNKLLKFLLHIQLVGHLFIFGYILGNAAPYIDDYLAFYNQNDLEKNLNMEMNNYVKNNHHLPDSLQVLFDQNCTLYNNKAGLLPNQISYLILANPDYESAKEKAFQEKAYDFIKLKLDKYHIKIMDSSANIINLAKKYPIVWKNIKGESINYSFDYCCTIKLPGFDMKLNTKDDFIYHFIFAQDFNSILE